jgi:RNA polymerase sigma-70 factor (ECF subfamily)
LAQPVDEKDFLNNMQKHKGIINKVSRMYAYTEEDREDLVQEILLRLWKSYESFEGKSALSTWMYRVAVNTAITFLRKEKSKPIFIGDDAPGLQMKVFDTDESDEIRLELFYKAVKELNPVEKALVFYFMEGLSHREISEQLGISENNTRVKLNRTKEKLQRIIKTSGYEF